jgi:hypothetical protein
MATRSCQATIPAGETQPPKPWTTSIFPTSSRRRRPTGATHLGRSFPILSGSYANLGARRRRSGGGPGGGCARRPVGTYLFLHAVGDGNPVTVLGLAR